MDPRPNIRHINNRLNSICWDLEWAHGKCADRALLQSLEANIYSALHALNLEIDKIDRERKFVVASVGGTK